MASSKIKGITIEIGGETSKLGKALESAEKSSKSLQTELKGVNTLLKMDPSNVELIKQKQDLLTKSIAETENKLKTLKDAQTQVQEQFNKGEITEEQYRDFQREIVSTEQKLKGLKDEAKDFGTQMSASLKSATEKMDEFGTKTTDAGKKMLPATAAVAGLGTAAVAVGLDFDESMSKVQALSGATGEEFDKLRNLAQEMGATTKYSASESADALQYMALAGWKSEQMIDGLPGILNLAAASGMDLASASDIVTDYLGAFSLQASDSAKMADQLAFAQANANFSVDQISEAYKNCAANMNAAGQTMETTTSLLAAMAQQGYKGSEAGTSLTAIMRDLTAKMKDGKIAIGDTNITVQDAEGNYRNLVDIISDVEAATNGMGDAERATALSSTFTADSIKGMNLILNQGTDYVKDFSEKLSNADGTAQDMAATMQDNLKGKLTTLKSQLEGIAIQISDILVPILSKLADGLSKVFTWFSNLSPTAQKMVVIIAGLVASIGPLLIIVGKMSTGLSAIINVATKIGPLLSNIPTLLGGIKTAITGVTTVFKLLGSVVMANPIIAIITAIIAVFVLLWNKCEWFRDFWINLWDKIKEVAGVVWEAISGFFSAAWDTIKSIWETVEPFFSGLFEGIKKVVYVVVMLIAVYFETCWSIIKAVWEAVEPFFKAIWEGIKAIFNGVIDFFKTIFEGAWNAIKFIWDLVVLYYTTIWEGIKAVFTPVIEWFKNIFSKAWEGIKAIWNGVKTFFTNIWNGIKNVFSPVINWFKDIFTKAWNGITSVFSGVKNWFKENVWDKITSVFSGAKDKMAEIGKKIWDGLKSAFKNPLGLKVTYENVGGLKGKIVDALGLDGWPKLSFAAKGAVLKKATPLLAGEYPNAVNNPEIVTPQNIMRDTMMDALTDFTNVKSQGNSEIKTLTNLMNKYMPEIVANIGQNIVLDDNTLVGKLTPKIDNNLGNLAAKRKRGY